MKEQVRLCAIWPAENWLGTSLNQIQGWTTIRESYSCALEQGPLISSSDFVIIPVKRKEGLRPIAMTMTATAPFSTRPPTNCAPLSDRDDYLIMITRARLSYLSLTVRSSTSILFQICQPKLRILSSSFFAVSQSTLTALFVLPPTLSLSLSVNAAAPTTTSLTCWDDCISIFSRLALFRSEEHCDWCLSQKTIFILVI